MFYLCIYKGSWGRRANVRKVLAVFFQLIDKTEANEICCHSSG